MYSYGPPHMAVQKQDDQHEHTFSSCVRIRDAVLRTYLGRWTIGRSGERGSGISVLPARHDDDKIPLSYKIQYIWLIFFNCPKLSSRAQSTISIHFRFGRFLFLRPDSSGWPVHGLTDVLYTACHLHFFGQR